MFSTIYLIRKYLQLQWNFHNFLDNKSMNINDLNFNNLISPYVSFIKTSDIFICFIDELKSNM